MKRSVPMLSAAITLVLARVALAADDPPPSNTSIQERIDALQKQLDELKAEQEKSKLTEQEKSRVTFIGNRPTIISSDGRSSIALRALVQADTAYYAQDTTGPLSTDYRRGSVGAPPNRENNAARDLSSDLIFRRARFGIEGAIARDFGYKLTYEFGGSGAEGPARLIDGWISYTGFAPFTIQLGAFSPPANMEDRTTPDELIFIERASGSELSRGLAGVTGRTALNVRANGSRWYGSLSLTGRTVNDSEVFDSQAALIGRAATLIATGADYNLHTGFSATYVLHPADAGLDASGVRYGLRFRDRPELRVDDTRLIDTGPIESDHGYAVGAELAGNWRSLYWQAENYWYGIERSPTAATLSNPKFGAYYLQGSWIITGESHRYNMSTASYQSPRPLLPFTATGGVGAWELALRYSHADLNYHEGLAGLAPPADGVRGGRQDIWTFGLNWYVNANLRFLLNLLHVDVDRLNPASPSNPQPFGAPPATPPVGVQIGQDYNAVGLRSQFSF
jgi:phosphate-selective porin OprO/OprP